MVIRTVVHFEIPANDVERLSKFYKDCFGWKFKEVPMGEFTYWLISTGPQGKSVGGGMYRRMDSNERSRNYVGVDDIDSAIETFKKAGGTEMVGKQEVPGQGWSFIGADPEGNPIALWEPMKPPHRAKRRKARRRK